MKINGLVVRGVNESEEICLPRTYTRDLIPARRGQIPRPESAREWSHLETIADRLMPLKEDVDVALLIGANCTRAIKPREIISGGDDDPYAKRTALGWGIIGIVSSDTAEGDPDNCIAVNRIVTQEACQVIDTKPCSFAFKSQCKEILSPLQFSTMLALDFNERKEDVKVHSWNDKLFMKKMEEGICKQNGHYELPLPLKNDNLSMPNNKLQAVSRLNKLKKRMQSDSKFIIKDYVTFMKGMIESGYAERVLLTMKSRVVLPPPGVFQRKDIYLKRHWRRVQYLSNEFWTRWRREYLTNLQSRQKWQRPRRNLQVDDIVLMREDNQSRNKWPLARVTKVYADDDNLVRKVQVTVADRNLNNNGQRVKPTTCLDIPVQKLVLLMPAEQ